MITIENIFRDQILVQKRELAELLLVGGNIVKVERVISSQRSNPGGVYDQDEDELALLVDGYAELEFEEDGQWNKYEMESGDFVNIPAHLKHRVTKTDKGTTWLALFYRK